MKKRKFKILIFVLITGLTSCYLLKSVDNKVYLGNFKEYEYDFFESIRHNPDKEYYYKLPFELKFGGIRPYPYDTVGKKEYSWLRNPENLILVFNTVQSIGLDKFVSIEQYNKINSDWCCNTHWENKSLNEIVKGFLKSDTTSKGNDYFSKFWDRRRKERNLKETYLIFEQIDCFYNKTCEINKSDKVDTILRNLLAFDVILANSDTVNYQKTVIEYFDYLKSVKLQYSAYKLIFHNEKTRLSNNIKDSLLLTLKFDTIPRADWENMNDNINGWITNRFYSDPDRYYGP